MATSGSGCSMGIQAHSGGAYAPGIPYARDGGSWKIPRGYIKQSGVWVPAYALQPLSRTLDELKLSANLLLCLDAGDGASYSSGQVWSDTSGQATHFNRGSTSGAGADDPTFNGTPGGLSGSEFWSFDGADFFRKASANGTRIENIHKDNAIYTLAGWMYTSNAETSFLMGNTQNASGNTGFNYAITGTGRSNLLRVTNGSGQALAATAVASFPAGLSWCFTAVSVNEGAALGTFATNGVIETFNPTYSSPSSGSAMAVLEIASRGNAGAPLNAAHRVAQVAMWEGRALTGDELLAIFQATRDRYGV